MIQSQSAVRFQHLWSGSFLDGTLTLSKDPTNDTIIYFTLTDAIDIEFNGFIPIPPDIRSNPANSIDLILSHIDEQYCILQLHFYNEYIASGKKVH